MFLLHKKSATNKKCNFYLQKNSDRNLSWAAVLFYELKVAVLSEFGATRRPAERNNVPYILHTRKVHDKSFEAETEAREIGRASCRERV